MTGALLQYEKDTSDKPKHDYRKQGKANRAAGKRFELKVREDLEAKGWIVFRNSNDVEFGKGDVAVDLSTQDIDKKIVGTALCNSGLFKQAKSKWNPFTKMPMTIQSGFPDFLTIGRKTCGNCVAHGFGECGWEAKFVECKVNGTLSKIEKEKVEWIKQNLKIPIFVASKGEKREEIKYEEV